MINFIIWIFLGALIGWIASLIMKTDSRQGLIADIVVGIVGAFIGGYILSPLFNMSTINEWNFSVPALFGFTGWRYHSVSAYQNYSGMLSDF